MDYFMSILGYLSWPFLIVVSYQLIKLALFIFNKNLEKTGEEE